MGNISISGKQCGLCQTLICVVYHSEMCASGGGAIAISGGGDDIHIEQAAFIGNKAKKDGGAVILHGDYAALIIRSLFESNVATSGSAGALWTGGRSRIDLVASNFTDNRAMKDGGGVYAEDGCVVDLRGAARFDGNTALEGRGGALSLVEESSLLIDEGALVFAANRARLGGAVAVDEDSFARIFAGCLTITFEMRWADSTDSFGWAVVRRTDNAGTVDPASSITDLRGEWMILEPTPMVDTSVSFCLPPANYTIMGAVGGHCTDGWGGGYVRAVDRGGTELATLTHDDEEGCASAVDLAIAADDTLTSANGPIRFLQNVATGAVDGLCGTGCGGALYVGTVRPLVVELGQHGSWET